MAPDRQPRNIVALSSRGVRPARMKLVDDERVGVSVTMPVFLGEVGVIRCEPHMVVLDHIGIVSGPERSSHRRAK
jgi:hypothetical protein